MRTTITLGNDVYQATKTLAESSGKTLGEIVTDLLRRALKPSAPQREGKLPVFSVPSDAALIPGNRASELLDELDEDNG